MIQRIGSLVKKEFIQVGRDRRTLAMVLTMPVMMLFIFGYALSTDVRNIPTAVWDASRSSESRALIDSFLQTGYFSMRYYVEGYQEMARLIDGGQAKAGLVIPQDYALRLERREVAPVQFLIDGSDPSVAIPALSYANIIAQARSSQLLTQRFAGRAVEMPIDFQPRVLYNPNMESLIFNIPGLIGLILQQFTILLTAFAIVRERELGTMEQLVVTPIRPLELIIGKLLPYILIAFADVITVLLVATLIFGVPMKGSVLLLLVLSSVFLMFSLGIGILISTVSETQFQAMQMAFIVVLPTILLSGFMFPIEAMPPPAQWLAAVVPLTYFLRIIRGIVLRGVGIEYLWYEVGILAIVGVVTLLISAARMRRRLG